VICKSDGSKYQNIRKSWIRVLKKANLRKLSPHALRHTFATMLVREGADLMAVKELGRWSNLKLVERYAHVANDHRTRVIGKLDRFQSDTNGDTMDDN
jgi:site-specific recombinase XerD